MLTSLFLVASGLLVLSTANVIVPREVSGTSLHLCTDREAALAPGSVLQVQTPNFEKGNYADNTHCNLKLNTGTKDVHLYVTFHSLDLENNPTCYYDALCLNGVLFCGNWTNGRIQEFLVPANNSFTLDFKSDGSVTRRGISLTISAREYLNEYANIATSGYGSSSTSLVYSTHYLSTVNYIDKCDANANRAATSYPYTTTVYDYSTNSFYYYDSTTNNQWDYLTTNDYSTTTWYYDTTNDYYYTNTYNPWYDPTTNDAFYYSTYNPWDYQTTGNYYYTTTYNPWYYQTTYDYYYSTTSWYYPTTYDYYYSTTSWYYPTTYDYYYSTTSWYYQTTNDYYYSTTYDPWYYQTTGNLYYYYTTTYNPWYYQTTDNYYYSTTYYPRSSPYYETTSYNPWYYATTNYYQYTSDYYYTSTYNPCQNGYYVTTGYCQYYSSSPSPMNDYIANELRRALQEISTERSSQDQLFSILANLLQYLGHK